MNKIAELAEQYIYESQLHLAHIDALIARAAQAPLQGEAASETEALLQRMRRDRDRLALELDGLRRLPPSGGPDVVTQGENLRGVLATVGLQLEKALGAIFERNERRR